MSVPKRVYWCQCLWELINYSKNMDKAKGILNWSIEKNYHKVTSGAEDALKDSLKNLQNVMQRCDFYPEEHAELQRKLAHAPHEPPKEALKLLDEVEYAVRTAISRQCQIENKIMFEETRPERERQMREQREAIAQRKKNI